MSNPARRPYLGEPCHYQAHGSKDGTYPSVCRAAVITEVHGDNTAAVTVFNPSGMFFHQQLGHDENRGPGSWHYAH